MGKTQRNTYKRTVRVSVQNIVSGDIVLSQIFPNTTSIAEIMDIVSPRGKGILMWGSKLEDAALRKGQTLHLQLIKAAGSTLRRHAHIVER